MSPLAGKTIVLWDALALLPPSILQSWQTLGIQYVKIYLPNDPIPDNLSEYDYHLSALTPEAFEQLREWIAQHLGTLNILIHLSAILHPLTPIEYTPYDSWQHTIDYNLNQPFLLINQLLPALKCSNQSDIFLANHCMHNTSVAYWGSFYVSQIALQALEKILQEELRHTTIQIHQLDLTQHPTPLRATALPASSPLPPTTSILEQINQILSNRFNRP